MHLFFGFLPCLPVDTVEYLNRNVGSHCYPWEWIFNVQSHEYSKHSASTSDWNILVRPSEGAEITGSSSEKTVALFLVHSHKPMLALKGRFDDIIRIWKQLQATLPEFKKQDSCKCFQQWHAHWAHCIKLKWNYSKGNSVEQQVNAVILEKKHNSEIFYLTLYDAICKCILFKFYTENNYQNRSINVSLKKISENLYFHFLETVHWMCSSSASCSGGSGSHLNLMTYCCEVFVVSLSPSTQMLR